MPSRNATFISPWSAAQVERGLTDEDEFTRWQWSQRLDFLPTETQIERGLCDSHDGIRFNWARRDDFVMNEHQVERALKERLTPFIHALSERTHLFLSLESLERVVFSRSDMELTPLPVKLERRLRSQAEASHLNRMILTDRLPVKNGPQARAAL